MSEECYPLSVIIPIHRADVDIRRCLNSLLSNQILDLQIIVAANSEQAGELQRINRLIPNLPCITLLNIHQAGKSYAINKALNYVKNKYVLIGDADTQFVNRGLNQCIRAAYMDDSIVAITGIVDPIADNYLSSVQQFEYRRIFRLFRPFWNLFHANVIVSGCAGLFKTETLIKIGRYDCHTLGEDFEITLRIHDYYTSNNIPYKIEFVDSLIAKTDVPKSLRTLITQRGRWFTGQADVVWKYRRILIHPIKYKRIIIPYVLAVLFEVFESCLKWPLYILGLCVSYISDAHFFMNVLAIGLCYVLLEISFNLFAEKRLRIRRIIYTFVFTCALLGIQFILKDTNVVSALKLMRRRENKW